MSIIKKHKSGIPRYQGPTKVIGWRVAKDIVQSGDHIANVLALVFNDMWDALTTKKQLELDKKFNSELILIQKILPLEEV